VRAERLHLSRLRFLCKAGCFERLRVAQLQLLPVPVRLSYLWMILPDCSKCVGRYDPAGPDAWRPSRPRTECAWL